MSEKMRVLIALLLVACVPFAKADLNSSELQLNRGVYLFYTNRFQNAEDTFRPLVRELKNENPQGNEYYASLYYFAMSLSEQGKTQEVKELSIERLLLGITLAGEFSFETAKNQLNLGEMYYREADLKNAYLYLDKAEATYNKLSNQPKGFLEFIASNREEYKSSIYSKDKLPEDFSTFYTACESISVGNEYKKEREKLSQFVEAGVDFEPTGIYEEIFTANLLGVSGIPEHDKRSVFIPRNDASVYDEWCILYVQNKKVVGFGLNEG